MVKDGDNIDRGLLAILSCELGHVIGHEDLCPGVYYLTILDYPKNKDICDEYYLILDNAPISQEARALGKLLPETSALLYHIASSEGGWTAVMYEICSYRAAHGLPNPEGWSPEETAQVGKALCPAYFDDPPALLFDDLGGN